MKQFAKRYLAGFGCIVLAFLSVRMSAQAQTGETETKQSLVLHGRIEELVNEKGAKLPRQLQSLTPVLDESLSKEKSSKAYSGKVVKAFPEQWQGIWKGDVTVKARESLELGWLTQPASAYRSAQFFKPGSSLSLLCRFHRENGELTLSPPIVKGKFKHAEDLLQAVLEGSGKSSAYSSKSVSLSQAELQRVTQPIWRMESFSFGKQYGPSVGGTFVDSQILSNDIRELSPGIIEQAIVSKGVSKSVYGASEAISSLGESVLRFSKKDDGSLFVQLAYVNYQHDGLCVNKVMLEGNLTRQGD